MSQPKGYSATQIVLHWAVFALIALQFLLNDAIGAAYRAVMRGQTPEFGVLVLQHVAGGVLILALVIWRMVLKVRRGAPLPPAHEPSILQKIATGTHLALYLFTIVTVLSGGLAWFGGLRAAGTAHEIFKTVLLVLIGLHVAGALYQKFVLKSDVMARMLRPE